MKNVKKIIIGLSVMVCGISGMAQGDGAAVVAAVMSASAQNTANQMTDYMSQMEQFQKMQEQLQMLQQQYNKLNDVYQVGVQQYQEAMTMRQYIGDPKSLLGSINNSSVVTDDLKFMTDQINKMRAPATTSGSGTTDGQTAPEAPINDIFDSGTQAEAKKNNTEMTTTYNEFNKSIDNANKTLSDLKKELDAQKEKLNAADTQTAIEQSNAATQQILTDATLANAQAQNVANQAAAEKMQKDNLADQAKKEANMAELATGAEMVERAGNISVDRNALSDKLDAANRQAWGIK